MIRTILKLLFDFITSPILLYKKNKKRIRLFYLRYKGIEIGEYTYISPKAYIDLNSPKHVKIGKNCNIARNVIILCHSGETKGGPKMLWEKYGGGRSYHEVNIGDNVFIGANSVILPGVSIGSNSIVGCNTVVNKNVSSGKIVGGVPFKEIMDTKELLKKKCKYFDIKDWNHNFSS